MSVQEVETRVLRPERFEEVLPPERYAEFAAAMQRARELFEGRRVWNINSTASGGGVAEMLRSLLAYCQGIGVDARWLVIGGNPDFFRITKRIHNFLHGSEGDGGELGDAERRIYEETIDEGASELVSMVAAKDVVLVHDPQPAGLVARLKEKGASVIWRCHVGLDLPTDVARQAWQFLLPYVTQADSLVFSRREFAWEGVDGSKIDIIRPSIDAFSAKNQELDGDAVSAILAVAGLLDGEAKSAPTFHREDGSPAQVQRTADYIEGGDAPKPDDRLVLQVSRWDRLKDPVGVIRGFAEHVAPQVDDVHLVVAGPDVEAVADDPEGAEVVLESIAAWESLDSDVKARVHLASLPMDDGEENAAIVNALQRRADVVVQKSLAEGFGLTVAEAMWKARPVVASKIGGIQDQIEDGVTGLLVQDPKDLEEYGGDVADLLQNAQRATEIGKRAQNRVRDEFLGPRHLTEYLRLIERRHL
ncbi:MAG: trehalose synthase [Actinomycetota bacterium]|nr:trehalose synthase [Actinomycetota bacterium]